MPHKKRKPNSKKGYSYISAEKMTRPHTRYNNYVAKSLDYIQTQIDLDIRKPEDSMNHLVQFSRIVGMHEIPSQGESGTVVLSGHARNKVAAIADTLFRQNKDLVNEDNVRPLLRIAPEVDKTISDITGKPAGELFTAQPVLKPDAAQ